MIRVHHFTHKTGQPHKYTDTGSLVNTKPVVVPPLPPQGPGVHHGPKHPKPNHHHPPFFSWAGIWDGVRYGLDTIFSAGSDDFTYSYYVTDPDSTDCTPSPWYYYPNLPPYVDDADVKAADPDTSTGPAKQPAGSTAWNTTEGQPIPDDWKPDLPHAIDDLMSAWQKQDKGALTRLLPKTGQVLLHVEGQDFYNLEAKDFADLFKDGVMNTQTVKYEVESSKQLAPNKVLLYAVHTFKDPWGETRTIDHKYVVVLESPGYVIREFRSSTYR
jgi:hypothetical protein